MSQEALTTVYLIAVLGVLLQTIRATLKAKRAYDRWGWGDIGRATIVSLILATLSWIAFFVGSEPWVHLDIVFRSSLVFGGLFTKIVSQEFACRAHDALYNWTED